MMLYICGKFRENNQRVSEFLGDVICILKFAKGHNSVKSISGVMVLGLSTSSDSAKASLILSTKNFSVFGDKVVKHLTS